MTYKLGDILKGLYTGRVCEIIGVSKKYYRVRKLSGYITNGDIEYDIATITKRWRKLTKLEKALK